MIPAVEHRYTLMSIERSVHDTARLVRFQHVVGNDDEEGLTPLRSSIQRIAGWWASMSPAAGW